MSFLTCRCDLPQKLHRSCSFCSVGRAIPLLRSRAPSRSPRWPRPPPSHLLDYAVDEPVFRRFLGAHEVVALGVLGDLVEVLARVLGDDLVEPLADVDDLPRVDLDVRRLALEARGDLVDEDLRVRKRHTLARGSAG